MTTATQEKTVTINIDGQYIEATANSTILEAARAVDIHIPTLCYHPRLSVVGSCRVCMVAVEGVKGVVPACATPVRNGMIVKTCTPEVLAARKMAVELLLSTHPSDYDDDAEEMSEFRALVDDLGMDKSRC